MLTQTIPVSDLQLDLDNSRFPEAPDSQRDAITKMVELQGDKLVNLAKDIIEHGMDPSERLIVLKEDEHSYVVAEGNRRVTTLKLLNQPDLVGENRVTSKIKRMLKSAPDIPSDVDCVVFENEEDFEHWVNLKHTGENQGVGRVRWTGQESDRHRAKHGNTSFGNQLLAFIHTETKIPADISGNSRRLKITNLNRLLGDPDVRKSLGLEPPVEGVLFCYEHKITFTKKMLQILNCMLELDDKGKPAFTVDRIKKKQDREVFINELNIEAPEKMLAKPWKVSDPLSFVEQAPSDSADTTEGNGNQSKRNNSESGNGNEGDDAGNDKASNSGDNQQGEQGTSKGSEPGSSSTKANPNRNNLIPVNVNLKISDKKCSGVYRELKTHLKHDKQPNSIAVMLRVFLDLSVSFYIDLHKITLENNKTGLHDKVVKATEHLMNEGKINKKQRSAIQAASADTLKSNGSIQQYVHNNHMFPDKTSINSTWSNFEPLLVGIWS